MLTKKQVSIISGARNFKVIGNSVYKIDYMTGNLTEVIKINLKNVLNLKIIIKEE